MRRVPIRLRVAGAFALAMAIVLTGTAWFLYARLGSHLAAALDRELRLRAQDLGALVQQQRGSLSADKGGRFIESGESYAQLLDQQGRVLDGTRPLGTDSLLNAEELRAARRDTIFANRSSVPGLDEPSRFLATPVSSQGRRLVLIVGATREDRRETLVSLRNELLIAGPAALLLASLAGYFLAGFALRPVESMRARAAAISADTPGERLPVPPTRDEIERLAETLNDMLARLEDALQRERDFVADAGHELRTPLALLRTELELALHQAETPEELREAVRSSSEEADRLSQLAEDLLLIARSDRGGLPLQLEAVEVDTLFESILSRFEWRAEDAGRSIRSDAAQGMLVRGDRLRLEQALGNLVDNALRYGEGEIRLSVESNGSVVEFHVTDSGRGFPAAFLDRAFERFSRSDPARPGGGAGLGLSIVKSITEAHGGNAYARNLSEGGADVWLAIAVGPPEGSEPAVRTIV